MLTLHSRLCPNEDEVSAKVMDGEAIIINFSNGIYYSMDKVGGLVWEMVEGTHSLAEIMETILDRYLASPEQVKADIEKLVAELLQENLVKETDDSEASGTDKLLEVQDKLHYESPQLTAYRDMAQLLALDPPMPGLKDIAWKEPQDEAFP